MAKKLIKLYIAIDEDQDKLLTEEQKKLQKKIGYEISKKFSLMIRCTKSPEKPIQASSHPESLSGA